MILVLCLDDKLGMAFNGRRQSRDRLLIADLAAIAGESTIYMLPRSASLFEGCEANVVSCEDFQDKAAPGEYCFLEFSSPAALAEKAEGLIIYRWNRRYQADLFFDIDMSPWKMESSTDFCGSSHEKITREVYSRE